MAETGIKIEGMSCQRCVMAVKKAITGLKGVGQADVTIGNASVQYDESSVKKEEIEAAIEKSGFKVSQTLHERKHRRGYHDPDGSLVRRD